MAVQDGHVVLRGPVRGHGEICGVGFVEQEARCEVTRDGDWRDQFATSSVARRLGRTSLTVASTRRHAAEGPL